MQIQDICPLTFSLTLPKAEIIKKPQQKDTRIFPACRAWIQQLSLHLIPGEAPLRRDSFTPRV